MKAYPVPCGPAVNESERKAIAQLKTRIISVPGDDEWWLLTNLAFSATHRLQSDEIDIVAIGPPGVRIMEVKHWTAAWINRNSDLVEQEAERVIRKARRISTTLRRRVRELPHVDGVFLTTEAAARVKGLEGREPVRGVSFHTFSTWRGAVGLDAPNVLSLQQVRELGRFLQPRNAVAPDGALKRLAGYTRLQLRTPSDEQFHRIYSATHASRQDQVVLHLYDLSLANDDSKAADKAEREWKSLQRLQHHGWAQGREVAPSDDLYALAASFFHVLFEREPFLHDGIRSRDRGLAWQDVERDEYPLLAAFLDRATDPDPERRFATTAEALAALRPARTTESPGVAAPDEPDLEHGDPSATSDGTESERSERRENEVP